MASFSQLADQTLDKIVDFIETSDSEGSFDVDYSDGMIEIIDAKDQVFIVNKHSAAQEIWLASPISGPHHFCYCPTSDSWISTRSSIDLLDILSAELQLNFLSLKI